ncbi:STAS/SEC14 domain-containing protein [Vibrio plantisponsor]|uniref:STAS/SEC14 domain-containing protein n=1 Tax=Vibrio plantisponsor TaxID=664643 RepID=A0ABU4IKZ4_9VIBR|nr:STAS/SEC14 domain-containing protein [Vibrio plantisponsor]MDW6019075.1 STAS/SEC14 domain-containing protein [Vibrio plantisponsor]NNM41091.1 STAS/SEC14 domain-containing protein [Vibrio plantisponsor]
MSIERHGLSIGLDRIGNEFIVSIKAVGRLTHDDYQVISPMIDAALIKVNQPKVKVLFDATELKGWELRAAWDDFKLGLKHGSDFDKIALYGNRDWQEVSAKIGNWFVSGEIKYFENYSDAVTWLKN